MSSRARRPSRSWSQSAPRPMSSWAGELVRRIERVAASADPLRPALIVRLRAAHTPLAAAAPWRGRLPLRSCAADAQGRAELPQLFSLLTAREERDDGDAGAHQADHLPEVVPVEAALPAPGGVSVHAQYRSTVRISLRYTLAMTLAWMRPPVLRRPR